jgi:hypothetical protein
VRLALALSAAALAALALPACGGHSRPRPSAPPAAQRTPPPPGRRAADPRDVRVIRAWSDALRRGLIDRATGYFAVPAIVRNGGDPVRLRSRAEVFFFNATLPCGAVLDRAYAQGRYTVAIFRLTDRRGVGGEQGCDGGRGAPAGTAFAIHAGRITQWLRVPVPERAPAPPALTGPAV